MSGRVRRRVQRSHRFPRAAIVVAVALTACTGTGSDNTTTESGSETEDATPTTDAAQITAPDPGDFAAPTTSAATEPAFDDDVRYRATITWTDHGIPHIDAQDLPSAFYAQGWAMANDHGCTLVDQIIKVRGERARTHGPGPDDAHIRSDVLYQALDLLRVAEEGLAAQSEEARAVVTAFAAGVSRFIEDAGTDGMPGWCAGTSWVRPVTDVEVYAYVRDFALFSTTRNLIDPIVMASPPRSDDENTAAADETDETAGSGAIDDTHGTGSNAWAIGSDLADGVGALLVGNPHFPLEGELRFWESHLRVEGELDVYGATLLGLPGISVGFSEQVAWTRTVSAGRRVVGYRYELAPGDPTSYRYGNEIEAMEPIDVTVEVADPSEPDVIRLHEHTLWRTRHGFVVQLPGGDWTENTAWAVANPNETNDALIEMMLGQLRAANLDEFEAATRRSNGEPFTNLIVAGADGRVLYVDAAVTPNVPDDALDRWAERRADDGLLQLYDRQRITVLDGSDPRDQLIDDPRSAVRGAVPYDELPRLERTDWVMNSNDSYWLTNPAVDMPRLSVMHGATDVPPSPRTRRNLLTLTADRTWGADELWEAALSNLGLAATLLRDPVVERCRTSMLEPSISQLLGDACAVIETWTGAADLDAPGAVLWREFTAQFSWADHTDAGALWAEPFDPADPIGTPAGLASTRPDGSDPIIEALIAAVIVLETAGLPLDATLRDTQFLPMGPDRTDRIPIHGAGPLEGVENIIGFSPGSTSTEAPIPKSEVLDGSFELSADGYPINYGTSYLLVVGLGPDGPEARALLVSGQTGDLSDERSMSDARLFADKQWRPIHYRTTDIDEHAMGEQIELIARD